MQRPMTILTSLLVTVAATSGAIGCSSSSPATDPTPTVVSFKNDVMPIFHLGCTISLECHGQPNNSAEANLYLGKNGSDPSAGQGGGDNDAMSIMMTYTGLFGVKALEDPKMDLVTATDPANSFLFHKINDDQGTLNGLACTGGTCPGTDCDMTNVCGSPMPKTANMLDPSKVKIISDWITQGAKNN